VRVLITGGLGFIGSHLVETFLGAGWEVVVVDRAVSPYFTVPAGVRLVEAELDNRGALGTALRGVDVVFHLAWTGESLASSQDMRTHVELNLLPSLRLFELCEEAGVGRVVFFSSGGTAYGPAETLPIPEEHPRRPISPYGLTKTTVEDFLAMHGSQFGLDYVVVRPSVPYGERQSPRGVQGAVAVFLGKALRGEPIVIWGDGSVVRDYFYVGDLARGCLLAATTPEGRQAFNFGGGNGITMNRLVELVRQVTGRAVEVRYEEGRAFDVPELVLDIERARRVLGWSPAVAIEEGLERTWRWIRSRG
jgi:UDP-glucose 4-epimerase